MPGCSYLTIDLDVIRKNVQKLTSKCGALMGMVKGNGYGTDAVLLSKFLQNCGLSFLGVSHTTEAIHLRENGVTHPIFVISVPPFEAKKIVDYQLTAALSTFEEAEALNEEGEKQQKTLPVHLHLNTGMNRFGAALNEGMALYQYLQQAPFLNFEGVMTHFAAANSIAYDPFTLKQISLFKRFVGSLPETPRWIHAANTPGAVRFSLPFCNLARVGLELLNGALSLTSHLHAIHWVKKGESVGYLRAHTIEKESLRVGVIPFGYCDGFHRSIIGKGYVLIHGKKAPMIGSLFMDFMMVDLSEIPEAELGDQVTLFNRELPLETIAEWENTDVREILVRLSPRIERKWKNEQKPITLPSSVCSIEENSHSR